MDDKDWLLLSWVKRSKNRKEVLIYLLEVDEPRTPTEIADKLSKSRENISRALTEMRSDDRPKLVKRLNPDAPYDIMYKLTTKGQEIAEKIIEIDEE